MGSRGMTGTSAAGRGYREVMSVRGRVLLLTTLAACAALSAGPGEASAAPKRLFGVATVGDPTPTQVQRAAAGGATTMRVELSWATIEPTQGARNWASADAVMASTAAANVRLLPLLYGSPKWVSSNFATPPIYTPKPSRLGSPSSATSSPATDGGEFSGLCARTCRRSRSARSSSGTR